MDGRNPAPPKKPWNDDSPANTNEQWFPMVLKVVQDFVHQQYVLLAKGCLAFLLFVEGILTVRFGRDR